MMKTSSSPSTKPLAWFGWTLILCLLMTLCSCDVGDRTDSVDEDTSAPESYVSDTTLDETEIPMEPGTDTEPDSETESEVVTQPVADVTDEGTVEETTAEPSTQPPTEDSETSEPESSTEDVTDEGTEKVTEEETDPPVIELPKVEFD